MTRPDLDAAARESLIFARLQAWDKAEEEGCCFPGRCCMPGYHMRSECHTAEMMDQMIEDGEA